MKRTLSLLLALALVLSLLALAGCSKAETPAAETPAAETPAEEAPAEAAPAESAYKVAMITDYGDITDQSFNQNTYEGCKEFCEANSIDFKYYKPAGDSTAERVAMVDAAVADGYNVLVMPGYAFGGTIVEAAPTYPDVKFIALDVSKGDILEAAVGESYDYTPDNWNLADYLDMSNVYCAVYKEELCGYMAGYAAVKLGYTHLGFMGGMAVPAVVRYGYGFVQGADAAAEGMDDVVIEYAYANQFFGDADITAYCDTWYQTLGVQAVFACGGGVFTSVAEAAAKVDGGKVIGVDVDQSGIIDAYGEGMTITSAMKGLSAAVQAALSDIVLNDKWADYSGKIESLGLVSGDDPESNFVQIPYESTQWGEGFTQDDYKAMVKDMFDGKIVVSDDISADPAVVNITLNNAGNVK